MQGHGAASGGGPTHPASTTPARRLISYKAFLDTATQAFSGAFPSSSESKYQRVVVLLLRWEDDDTDVAKDLSKLQDVFEKCYHFTTKTWIIPSSRSDATLSQCLYDFRDANASSGNLLIVYYGGRSDQAAHTTANYWRRYDSTRSALGCPD